MTEKRAVVYNCARCKAVIIATPLESTSQYPFHSVPEYCGECGDVFDDLFIRRLPLGYTVEEGIKANIERGYLEYAGEKDGEPAFRLTEAGKKYAAELLKKSPAAQELWNQLEEIFKDDSEEGGA